MTARGIKDGTPWLLASLAIAALAACSFVEPMRWRLPLRYLITPLEISRSGSGDFTMCMRVALSPQEAEAFVNGIFKRDDRIALSVPMDETRCPAAFWPRQFAARTAGYNVERWPDGAVGGSEGAVYENGHLYFWANAM